MRAAGRVVRGRIYQPVALSELERSVAELDDVSGRGRRRTDLNRHALCFELRHCGR
jgi:hypothetical protein